MNKTIRENFQASVIDTWVSPEGGVYTLCRDPSTSKASDMAIAMGVDSGEENYCVRSTFKNFACPVSQTAQHSEVPEIISGELYIIQGASKEAATSVFEALKR